MLSACVPSDPEPVDPPIVLHRKRAPLNIPNPLASTTQGLQDPSSGPLCPEFGENCYIIIPSGSNSPYNYPARYSELKTSYENNTLENYLNNNSGWEVILPGLNKQSIVYNKLISGIYKMNFYSDSAIAIFDPAITGDIDNVIYYVRVKE